MNTVYELAAHFALWAVIGYTWMGTTIGAYERWRKPRAENLTGLEKIEKESIGGVVAFYSAMLLATAHLIVELYQLWAH